MANLTAPLTLAPGEYRLYTDQFVALPPGVNPTPLREIAGILSGMEVYPNPAGSVFSVDFSLDESAAIQIEVTDLTGKIVSRTVSEELPSGIQHFEINTNDWQPGVYITTVRDERGAQLKKKLIKL